MFSRDEWLAAVESRIARLEEKAEEKAVDLAVLRDRVERFEQAVYAMANNVIEMQQLRRDEASERARILTLIERQARATETIETQLLTKLDSINTNAGKAADKATEITARFHVGNGVSNGANGEHHEHAEHVEVVQHSHSDKDWIPRLVDAIRRLPARTWIGMISTILALAAVGYAFYLVEITHRAQIKALDASLEQLREHK
jgi:hypothetical protein